MPFNFTFAFTPMVQQAFTDVLVDFKNFFRISWIIMLAVFVCTVIPVGLSGAAASMGLTYNALALLLSIANMAILACFIASWYQQTLLGQNKDQIIQPTFDDAQRTMAITYAKLFGIIGVPVVVLSMIVQKIMPGFIGSLIGLALFLGAFYVSCRLCVATPLTAQGSATPLKTSWEMTKNDLPSIAGGAALTGIAFYVPLVLGIIIVSFVVGLLLPHMMVEAIGTALKSAGFVMFFAIAANYNASVLAELKNPIANEITQA